MKTPMFAALEQARTGLQEGGIPIGSVLVIDEEIVGQGRNRRVQQESVIKHAEMDCLENAGRRPAQDYRRSVLYSTLSPCDMCSGAVLLYGIPELVVGEARTFQGPTAMLLERGVRVSVLDDEACRSLLAGFIERYPELWHEDIGV